MIVALREAAASENALQAQHCQRLAYVLTVTQQMLALAEAGQWSKVADLEAQRRSDLHACFAQTPDANHSELLAEALAALLHLNEELMSKLRVARHEVMSQGQELASQRHAADAYRAVDASR